MSEITEAKTSIPRSTKDLAWAAGFLEGEGCFSNYGSPIVTAAQVQREPLDRLSFMFGGNITYRKINGAAGRSIWTWRTHAYRAAEIMMTLYVPMSPKRKGEIEYALTRWRASRLMKRSGTGLCARGHPLDGYNAVKVNGYIRCRECRNFLKRHHRAALKKALRLSWGKQ